VLVFPDLTLAWTAGDRAAVGQRLVGRNPRANQDHLAQPELTVRLLGADQVTEMWRIETAAQDSDSHVS